MNWKQVVFSCALGSCVASSAASGQAEDRAVRPPNVLFIVCDDLNDYVEGYGSHPQTVTPNLARLAESSVTFLRAYSNQPVCAPSRASFLTGIYPHRSGKLFWTPWFQNTALSNSHTLMSYFREHGYHTAGTGKLMHHFRRAEWAEFKNQADYGPFVSDGEKRMALPTVPGPFRSIGPVDGSYGRFSDLARAEDPSLSWVYGHPWGANRPFRYVDDDDRDLAPDEMNAQWAAGKIAQWAQEERTEPFFLAVGFIRPHTPLHAPDRFFDMFPLDEIQLPPLPEGDAEDTHFRNVIDESHKGLRYYRTLKASYPTIEDGLRVFIQAYLASTAFVDEQIGVVLDALDNSPFRDNTIVVVTSDHGFHMGEKEYLFKGSPWERSTRVPLIIRAPGVAVHGARAGHPVALIDLYPTLIDLCGIEGDNRKNEEGLPLDGFSMRPFLADPAHGQWDGPEGALSMIFAGAESRPDIYKQHWSLRTRQWRYILYNNGAEELYDHQNDPHEWHNLAGQVEYETVRTELRDQLMGMLEE